MQWQFRAFSQRLTTLIHHFLNGPVPANHDKKLHYYICVSNTIQHNIIMLTHTHTFGPFRRALLCLPLTHAILERNRLREKMYEMHCHFLRFQWNAIIISAPSSIPCASYIVTLARAHLMFTTAAFAVEIINLPFLCCVMWLPRRTFSTTIVVCIVWYRSTSVCRLLYFLSVCIYFFSLFSILENPLFSFTISHPFTPRAPRKQARAFRLASQMTSLTTFFLFSSILFFKPWTVLRLYLAFYPLAVGLWNMLSAGDNT